jgi:chromosome segregation ATPase
MRRHTRAGASLAVLIAVMTGTVSADDANSRASREREMLRRAQEALRQSQQDNGELTSAKQAAEQKLKAAEDDITSARNASKSAQASLRNQLQAGEAARLDLTHQLEAAQKQVAALTAEQKATKTQLGTRESELKQTRDDLDKSHAAEGSCQAKNLQLYEYSREILQRYEHKGVWASLAQKEPVLGFKQVGIENVVQEYQDKLDSQKLPPANTEAPKSTQSAP